ncbi:hypothetical protein C0Q70_08092 [Pomacea canaliculata]|uniref:Uncharacterized protein n=1 Tax=Pomacea canaliculata TaxID=400727 RepID=A0A2T7PGW3_POMCA|nr:hypothetical protein C0Q70_08092 [Pomacea canaliculata]
MCHEASSNMSRCCMLSPVALRCTKVTCPVRYYPVFNSSTSTDFNTSLDDNEVPAQKETTVTYQESSGTLAPSLSTTTPQSVSDESKEEVSANQSNSDAASFRPLTSEAPRHLENISQKAPPLALMADDNSPQWQISEHFSWSGGVLKVASSGVCLEVGEGAVNISDVVTICGAVSTDLTNAYDVLPLPEDEIIVSPIADCLAEAKPRQTTHSENTNVKNLASQLESSSLDSQTSSVNISQGCSMLRHESHSGHVRELSDTSSANPFSIQHVRSLYVNCSTPSPRDQALGNLVFGAECVDTQERDSSLRNSVNHNMTYPTPASDHQFTKGHPSTTSRIKRYTGPIIKYNYTPVTFGFIKG